MPRKKILWLCSWYPSTMEPFNGDFIQRHARAAALYNDIYVIHIAADTRGRIKKTIETTEKADGLTEHIVCFSKSQTNWGRLVAHYRLLRYYRNAIRQYIKENGKPDIVHVQVPVWAGVAGLWLKRRFNIPLVVTEHWGIYNDIELNNYKTKPSRFKRHTKAIFDNAVKFISVSNYLAEGVNKMVIKKEWEVVPNTVNTAFFNYKEKRGSVFRFIHVSNMVPLKNAEGIMRAFASLYHQNNFTELIMVGDTDPGTREFAAGLGLPGKTIGFRGEIAYGEVAKEMQGSDCLVVFSNIENSPCVIGEALCCGLPVITTRVGGIPELVNESNAMMVEPGNEELLMATMKEMIASYSRYNRLKIAEDARDKFNYNVIGKRFDEIYKEASGEWGVGWAGHPNI